MNLDTGTVTKLVRAAALAAGAVLLASCGSGTAAQETAAPDAAAPASPGAERTGVADDGPPPLSPATTALRETLNGSTPVRYDRAAVTGTTLDGEQIDAAELDGPVVYWFWAPWCTVCRAEAPALARVAEQFADEVTFIGVAGLGPQDDMEAFVAETGVAGFEHIADVDGTVWSQFGVTAQPAFVFVDREGSATGWLGALDEPVLTEVTTSLAG